MGFSMKSPCMTSYRFFKEPIIGPLKSNPPSLKSTRLFSAVSSQIWIKFRMHNYMPTAVIWSKPKPEVEFQYGGRLFFETGNSYITAAD